MKEKKPPIHLGNSDVGLECAKCGCRHFFVGCTKRAKNKIIRYKQCRNCGHHIRTVERVAGG